MATESKCIGGTQTENWCTTKNDTVEYSLKWTIENFSFCNKPVGQCLVSNDFTSEKPVVNARRVWRLKLYPNGYDENYTDFVSIYLILSNGKNVDVKCNMEMLNSAGKSLRKCVPTKMIEFDNERKCYGWPDFIQRKTLSLVNDEIFVICKLTTLSDVLVSGGKTVRDVRHPAEKFLDLSEDLGKLFESQTLTDCVFKVGDRAIGVHKALLVSRSPVFRAMFEHNTEERRKNEIVITDMDYEVLQEMIRFMYTNETTNLHKMAEKLLAAANKYDLNALKSLCENALINVLTPENVLDVLLLADAHNAQLLKQRSMEFMKSNALDVVKVQIASLNLI